MYTGKLVVAADHGGVELKNELVRRLRDAGVEVDDLGTDGDSSVHYPDYAFAAARKVARGEVGHGVLVCGTGIGMSIAANKVEGVLAAKVNSEEEGRLAAEHNHANILTFGGRTTDADTAFAAIQAWLKQEHGQGRHAVRVGKIKDADSTRS